MAAKAYTTVPRYEVYRRTQTTSTPMVVSPVAKTSQSRRPESGGDLGETGALRARPGFGLQFPVGKHEGRRAQGGVEKQAHAQRAVEAPGLDDQKGDHAAQHRAADVGQVQEAERLLRRPGSVPGMANIANGTWRPWPRKTAPGSGRSKRRTPDSTTGGKRDASGEPFEQDPAPGELVGTSSAPRPMVNSAPWRTGVVPGRAGCARAALHVAAAAPGTEPQSGHIDGKERWK